MDLTWTRLDDTRWHASTDAQEFAAEVDLGAVGWHAARLDSPTGYPDDRGTFADLGDAMRACND